MISTSFAQQLAVTTMKTASSMCFIGSIFVAAIVLLLGLPSIGTAQTNPDRQECWGKFEKAGIASPLEGDFFNRTIDRLLQLKKAEKCWDDKMEEAAKHPRIQTEEEKRTQRQAEIDRRNFQQMVAERRTSLRNAGVTFEFTEEHTAWFKHYYGCLIGEGGNVYTYDMEGDEPRFGLKVRLSEREFSRAVAFALSVGDETMSPQRATAFDAGLAEWTMSRDGVTTTLKLLGDAKAELPDPNVQKIVGLISAWCLSAKRRIEAEDARERIFNQMLQLARSPPVMERGTAAEARSMLRQAISELKIDRKGALEKFEKASWKDLFVFCAENTGRLVSRPSLSQSEMDPIQDRWNKELGKKVLRRATKNRINSIRYTSTGTETIELKAYVTKVGSLACGVSYLK